MSKINYTILKKEITRDPIELEYHNKTLEEIVAIMNDRQFSEAALYDENGAQIFYATGKTSGGGGGGCACADFASASSQFTFVLTGIANGTCLNCTAWNGTHTLNYMTQAPSGFCGNCTWSEETNTDVCSNSIGLKWFLANTNFNSFSGWHLFTAESCSSNLAGGDFVDDYRLDNISPFDPVGSNTFNLQQTLSCTNMPSTITISTAGDTMVCNTVGMSKFANNQIKRSRAELLFGPDAVIEKEDIKLANLS